MELNSLEKGLAVLRELSAADGPLTPAEVAHATGLNRSTTYRLCEVLERGGWISRTPGDGLRSATVGIGPASHGLAVLITKKYGTEAKLGPIIAGLARTLSDTVHVGVLDHTQVVHVDRALPDEGPNMAASIGAREYAHATALGKALLATLPREEVDRLYIQESLPVRTPETIASRTALHVALEEIRRLGYAVDDGESRGGVRCIAAPVFDVHGVALVAISVTSLPQRLEGERFERAAEAVVAAANLATASFGGERADGWALSAGLR